MSTPTPSPAKPLPIPNTETAPFWDAAREGRLLVQRCRACGEHIFYPRLLCPHCMSDALEWVETSGRGTVYSFTIVHKAPPGFRDEAPYAVGLVDLAEGPRLMTRILADDLDRISVGLPVEVSFTSAGGGIDLPVFRACS
ncbi:Zn-ribbon domain-containing OB-fold protein [Azospirillum halopraeferens]|uniref:Zn-ribbon domain-containing OB-fold protein n=1 Tax=Azospirillum halopraeferens TaxID=34010 RepID=UPI000418EC63|nr:Zn-ribbon domain-containing OB-fold protein [Azospirillum halopraeferens]